jgi:NAD-dependent SIR2 family protein deacetylase
MLREIDERVSRAAAAIAAADALVIGAGAGMGVDSGLPDFRGDQGFWTAYPPFRGRKFAEISNPVWFSRDPAQAWGFFGHRLRLYRGTIPHAGFELLRRWGERAPAGSFVFTSNVDGHFQKAGFAEEHVVECHGSIHFLQCCRGCTTDIWPADGIEILVDETTIRAVSPLPKCVHCEGLARPNILMFGDHRWLSDRTERQQRRYATWLRGLRGKRLTVIELGAGLAVPTVRFECEQLGGTLIRVNPRDTQVPDEAVSLPLGALDALQRIDAALQPTQ